MIATRAIKGNPTISVVGKAKASRMNKGKAKVTGVALSTMANSDG